MPKLRDRAWQSPAIKRALDLLHGKQPEIPREVVAGVLELARSYQEVSKENTRAVAPKPTTEWEKFQGWFVKSSPVAMGLLSVGYLIYDQPGVHYPWPGEGFWTNEQVNNYLVMGVTAVIATAMLRPILAWTLVFLAGSLMVALMFGGR